MPFNDKVNLSVSYVSPTSFDHGSGNNEAHRAARKRGVISHEMQNRLRHLKDDTNTAKHRDFGSSQSQK